MNRHQSFQLANNTFEELIREYDHYQRRWTLRLVRQRIEAFVDSLRYSRGTADLTIDLPSPLSPFVEFHTNAKFEILHLLKYLNIRLEPGDWNMRGIGQSHGGTIVIHAWLQGTLRLQVMVHELAHELMHSNFPKNKIRPITCQRERWVREEAEAEAVSYIVMRAYGLHCSQGTVEYLADFGATISDLMYSRNDICDIASQILSAVARLRVTMRLTEVDETSRQIQN